ncbi:hypothetical protein [Actinomadura nitritigenes]|uniref:hypothetical protein n=1 Tax=Actinomadura nitritigenes TaxID=134602 RepID=UPI003D912EA2
MSSSISPLMASCSHAPPTSRRRHGSAAAPESSTPPPTTATPLLPRPRGDLRRAPRELSPTEALIPLLPSALSSELLDDDSWTEIARILLALGCDWPAVTDLAAMPVTSQAAVLDAVKRLAEQTEREMGDLPALDFWDTVCGLVARAWRLGVFDEIDAMYRMDGLWWRIRPLDRSRSQGLQIIWRGMGFKEMHDHLDVSEEAITLLIEADRLIPADSVNGPLCKAVLDAVY